MGIQLHPEEINRLFSGFIYVLDKSDSPAPVIAKAAAPEPVQQQPVVEKPVMSELLPESVSVPVIESVPESVPVAEPPKPEVVAAKEVPPVVTPPQPPVTAGIPIDWKLKPGAKVVFVMQEQEFKDRELTGFLKDQVQATQLDTSHVGFGVAAQGTPDWSGLPTPYGVGFGVETPAGATHLFSVPSLHEARTRPEAHARLILVLADLRIKLSRS